ncbi:hypothetical protein F5X68DRAFT_246648 [Plectosphaerella plurivora]|uniref:Protein kinase domain-containing protein n=1 Tax=Plectosphaerella plurivora TaxID=936078 RepID=A0A9P9A545_9PEZI|nr:hypothetical protein F5X68DRAFT_246648 [Plectosphaerella plurivora]
MAALSKEAKFLYEPGNILHLRSHLPPEPFGNIYYAAPLNRDPLYQSPEVISRSTVRELVFSKDMRERGDSSRVAPSAQTYFNPNVLGDKAAIQIIKLLSAARKKGPQVAVCDVRELPDEYWQSMGWNEGEFPSKVVAKIFDPLYFPSGTTASGGETRLDVISFTDKLYAHEAASYIEIHGRRGEYPVVDESTPKFYGTFTTTHKDANSTKTRQVRIVLLEYIEGTPLSDLCVVQHPPEDSSFLIPTEKVGTMKERLDVFARMLHCLVALEKIGVSRRTHSSRDILLRYVIHGFEMFGGWFPREWLDYEEPYLLHDAETDSDSGGEGDPDDETEGAGPSFNKWANKTFVSDVFIHADEADILAEEYELEKEQMDRRATQHVEELGS